MTLNKKEKCQPLVTEKRSLPSGEKTKKKRDEKGREVVRGKNRGQTARRRNCSERREEVPGRRRSPTVKVLSLKRGETRRINARQRKNASREGPGGLKELQSPNFPKQVLKEKSWMFPKEKTSHDDGGKGSPPQRATYDTYGKGWLLLE